MCKSKHFLTHSQRDKLHGIKNCRLLSLWHPSQKCLMEIARIESKPCLISDWFKLDLSFLSQKTLHEINQIGKRFR